MKQSQLQVVLSYTGLSMKDIDQLRSKLREAGAILAAKLAMIELAGGIDVAEADLRAAFELSPIGATAAPAAVPPVRSAGRGAAAPAPWLPRSARAPRGTCSAR